MEPGQYLGNYLKVSDDDAVAGGHLLHKGGHFVGRIEAEDKNLPESGHPGTGLDMVLHDGQAGHREQRLRHVEGQRSEARPLLRP